MPAPRQFLQWYLTPPAAPGRPFVRLLERPSGPSLLERLRAEAELASIGRSRFPGTLPQRNAQWLIYRNFLRQGLSNFRAAFGVDNRSASLLHYYAMLNFAKAELLTIGFPSVQGYISHGLRFNVTQAGTVAGDSVASGICWKSSDGVSSLTRVG